MKREVKVLVMAGCLFLCMGFAGCGLMEQTRQAAMASREKMDEKEAVSSKGYQEDADESAETEEEDKSPVLGGEEIEGYQGFDYLYEAVLMAYMDEDVKGGRIKRKSVVVYIPIGNDTDVNADIPGTAYSNTQGISFYVDVNPSITFPKESVSVGEKLDSYISHLYGGEDGEYNNQYEVDISDIHKIGKNIAAATVEQYWRPDDEEDYRLSYITYYMKELESDLLFFMRVKIDSSEATEVTPEILKELEAFYEVDIPWDKDEAEEKLEDYRTKKAKEIAFLPEIDFSFPEGWERDDIYSDEETAIYYAPGGDCDGAGCSVGIAVMALEDEEEYAADIWSWLVDEEYIKEAIMAELEGVEGMEIAPYGDTCIGETILIEFSFLSEGERTDCQLYLGEKDGSIYFVIGVQYQWLEMDTFEVVKELLESGEVREE